MTQPQWETIDLPSGSDSPFYKWGEVAGQTLTGAVIAFTTDGGTDFDGHSCPRIDVQLTEDTHTLRDGAWEKLPAGSSVTWQGNSPARLASALRQAAPARGDLIKLEHKGAYKTPKGTGKDIGVQIARGAGQQALASAPAAAALAAPASGSPWDAPASSAPQDASPPF